MRGAEIKYQEGISFRTASAGKKKQTRWTPSHTQNNKAEAFTTHESRKWQLRQPKKTERQTTETGAAANELVTGTSRSWKPKGKIKSLHKREQDSHPAMEWGHSVNAHPKPMILTSNGKKKNDEKLDTQEIKSSHSIEKQNSLAWNHRVHHSHFIILLLEYKIHILAH
jgi:hypothetical protein